jgi:transposase InsO family protein/transposase-like protein
MRRPYSRYSADFRAGAVALVERGDRKGRAVAEDLGINDWTLRDWVRDHQRMKGSKNKSKSPSEVPMNESLDGKVQRVEREIAKRDKRIAQLEMDREIRKGAAADSTREGKRVRFAFVHAERANFPVAASCRILGVTRQGYYAFIKREPSERVVRDAVFRDRVRAIHDENQKRYGRPRVIEQLRREGVRSSKRRVERAMRSMGLCARRKRRFVVTTKADATHRVAPNLLARDFDASRPDERWVTDITSVWTDTGWVYLAVILDLFSRAVVGWALDSTMSTSLPLAALNAAIQHRRPSAGLMHHSDRGCQYTSDDYRNTLDEIGVVVSMSRKGNCWDNAVAESFFATLKTELVHRERWSSVHQLRQAVFEYIEAFYNRRRLHSSLNYMTPAEVETAYALVHAA